jgi:threonine-phosphate decarboxylase
LHHRVLVRSCENYVGLDGRWFRIAVRTPEENDRLVHVLGEVLP